MSDPVIQSFYDHATHTITHVLTDSNTRHTAIIDSVLDYDRTSGRTSTDNADKVIAYVRDAGLIVDWILETHAHADHLSAAPYLQQQLGGRIGIGRHICEVQQVFQRIFDLHDLNTNGKDFDHLFENGEQFYVGEMVITAMHTPGHTPACMTYLVGKDAFVGDTLFMPDYGTARCDFPGGDAAMLYHSIQKIFTLPPDTRLHLCHDYPPDSRAPMWVTTVEEQSRHNVHVHTGISEATFANMRTERDKTLSMPELLMQSVQVNIRAGKLPNPDINGIRYLKIPVNVF
ncbi:MBL fold metallo-hydrolase [Undibacterium sp. SXout7W]|uniref:MBL fold metallo-hydrolase n=1 Tax=Undibacterium sp. SXout7W TaxID=3413049 RepID=UPI003BF20631